METLLVQAQSIVYLLLDLMPSAYQRDSLQTQLELFLQAKGKPLPHYGQVKSPSALSRFLNHYDWPTRQLIRTVRQAVLQKLMKYQPRGARPCLQVIVDLTTLEKRGKFKLFEHLIHVFHGKRGMHLVVLYLVVGYFRVPWGFRVWRGKGTPSAAQLAIRLISTLPKSLMQRYRVMLLADTAFGSAQFLKWVRKRKYAAIVGVRYDRLLKDGRKLHELVRKGQRVFLKDVPFSVSISWFYLKRDGKKEKRFVLSTRPLKGSTITWWGRRRWQIEGFFKTVKHRFGLHCFGQKTLHGMYRYLVLSLLSFLLSHWVHLSSGSSMPPDWGKAAASARQALLPDVVMALVLLDVERTRHLFRDRGMELRLEIVQNLS